LSVFSRYSKTETDTERVVFLQKSDWNQSPSFWKWKPSELSGLSVKQFVDIRPKRGGICSSSASSHTHCMAIDMHTKLHWLDVMYRCQHNKAPRYLMDHCTSESDVAYCHCQRSASSHEMKSLFHVTRSVPMDVGHLLLLARLSGTLCPRTCGIRRFLTTVTGSHWGRFYLRSTSVFSELEVPFFLKNALYKSTFDNRHIQRRLSWRYHTTSGGVPHH